MVVADVADEPRFAGPLQGMAEYFDYQHDHADDCWSKTPNAS